MHGAGDAVLHRLYPQQLSRHCSEDGATNRHLNYKAYYLDGSHIKLAYLHSLLLACEVTLFSFYIRHVPDSSIYVDRLK